MSLRPPAGFIRPGYNPLEVPDAPTIGAASVVSATSISIAFTAPSNVGGAAISDYLVIVTKTSDGSIVTATGSSSPVSVTGLTTGSAYTAKVVANNSYGPSAASASSGSVTPADPVQFTYLVVAGGGGGGSNRGGGGGAGGFRSGTSGNYFGGQSFTVTVGAGSTLSGNNSVFDSITSTGGGRGGDFDHNPYNAATGGSGGGGGGGNSTLNGGTGTAGQGNNGGSNGGYTGGQWASGGGGGAGATGSNASSTSQSGNGGNGSTWATTGSTYAGGGGGGIGTSGTVGSGGSGGGGNGSNAFGADGTNGTANTGGGGGGGADSGGRSTGGSGVVILQYPNTFPDLTIGAGLTYSLSTPTGFKRYTFTAGTGTVTV